MRRSLAPPMRGLVLSHRASAFSGAMLRIVVACLLVGVPAGFAQMIGHHALENPAVRT